MQKFSSFQILSFLFFGRTVKKLCLTLFRDLGRQRPGVVPAIPGYLICIIHLYIDHRKPPGGIYFRIVSTVLNTMEICKATVPHQCIKTGSFEYKYRAERSRKFGANALLLFIVLHSVFHLRLHIPHRVSAANGEYAAPDGAY